MLASADMGINRAFVAGSLLAAACAAPADPELVERFRAACAGLAAEAASAGAGVVAGGDGWFFAAGEVAALGADRPASEAAVAALASAAERLRRDGVALVVAPVPPKGVIYPDRLAPAIDVPIPIPRLDAALAAAYAGLRARGVLVVDLTEPFLRDRFHPEGPLYCRQDSHWSGVGCVVAAGAIAAAVDDAGLLGPLPRQPYGLAWFMTPVTGDLWRRAAEPPPREEVRARGLIAPDDPRLAPVLRDGDAPVTIVGDSHALVFHAGEPWHARGAGVAEQLAFEFRQPVALHADDGSAPAADPWTLPAPGPRTRVVIRIFAATRLLGGA